MTDLTPRGWPRPIVGGWPVPWVALPRELGKTDGNRRDDVLARRLCQVCGMGHQRTGVAYALVNEREPPAPGQVLLAMDDAIMHERCYLLAVGKCPALRRLRAEGRLTAWRVPVLALGLYEDDRTGEPRWGAPADACGLAA